MKITNEELAWIIKRIDWYEIKHQEIYDELFDHIVTAIETERKNGNSRPIESVFQNVVDRDFNGYIGIDKIIAAQKEAYRNKIRKQLMATQKSMLNPTSFILLMLSLVLGYYLPEIGGIKILLIIIGFILAIYPAIYAAIKFRKLKTHKGKSSLTKGVILIHSNLTGFFFFNFLLLVNDLVKGWNLNIYHILISPTFLLFFFFLFTIRGLSIMQVCDEELKVN